nr:receptor-like protein kinase FERONIA [Quercus suber]XP_023908279.1 receptor-like protein kinase FERONIA [Quercus suber]POE84206.1 receptor-like protein kinase feronia [Quercus suber]POF16000.1 receptor-like protein kinase feronia [Quercus suber]
MFSLFYVSLFFYYFTSPIASELLASYKPVENIAINCGSSGNSTTLDARKWFGDINSTYSPLEPHNLSNISTAPQSPTAAVQALPSYTVRFSRSKFSYIFSVTSGQKFIRLHFYPASYPDFDSSKAYFSVKAGNFNLLRNFSAALTADALHLESFSKEFCVNVGDEKTLNITFTPRPDSYAFINGIEVVSMPPNLYYTAAEKNGAGFIGQVQPYRIENNTALETDYRVNVGGKYISPAEDTGMYRFWSSDEDYLVVNDNSVLPVNTSISLNFNLIPNYTAPEEVYRTARTMGTNKSNNEHYNLTWEFSVDSGFFYMVRLHFCEFQPEITGSSQRVFYIYIANQTAENYADVFRWTLGGKGVPIYRDYVVHIGEGDGKKLNLYIALQANPDDWTTVYSDALLNGLEIFKISSNDNLAGPNPDPTPTAPTVSPPFIKQSTRRKINSITIIGIVSGVVSGIVLISIVGFFIFRRGKKVKEGNFGDGSTWWGLSTLDATKSTKTPGSTTLPSDLCRHFSLAEIKAATNNFDNVLIIGVGGFGNVYKGYIDGWAKGNPVAIKRLKPGSQQGAHEFETEIEMLSQLRHVHLVSLIGYCNDGNEMILVYDYMARGTLRDHLYNTNNSPLSWKKRMEICIGAAHGLNYLHTGAKHMIIHRDVKTTNILLDEEWTAKVCDFGLSKLGPTGLSKAHVSTAVKGSFGYLDPEYYLRQQLTEKSDVYSFGVVLCEVLCAKPPITRTVTNESVNLVEWVKRCRRDGKLDEIVDPFLKGTIAIECLKKFVEIATNCLLDNGTERPSMNDVAWGLEFALQLQENAGNKEVSPRQIEIEMMDAEKALIPKSIVDDSGDIFSSSDGQMSSTNSNSKVTITTKEDQSFASLDSDGLMSVGAVFSEIYIPKGR